MTGARESPWGLAGKVDLGEANHTAAAKYPDINQETGEAKAFGGVIR